MMRVGPNPFNVSGKWVVAANIVPTAGAPVPQLGVESLETHIKNNEKAVTAINEGRKPVGAWILLKVLDTERDAIAWKQQHIAKLRAQKRINQLEEENRKRKNARPNPSP